MKLLNKNDDILSIFTDWNNKNIFDRYICQYNKITLGQILIRTYTLAYKNLARILYPKINSTHIIN